MWVCHGVSQKNGLPKSDEIDAFFFWFPRPLNHIKSNYIIELTAHYGSI